MKVYSILIITLLALSSCGDNAEATGSVSGQDNNETTNLATKTGDHQEFFANGKVKMEGTLLRGGRIGTWTSYYENGKKQSENDYQSGARTGRTISYYQSGLKRYIGQYDNGKRTGNWIFFKEDGTIDKEENFNPKER